MDQPPNCSAMTTTDSTDRLLFSAFLLTDTARNLIQAQFGAVHGTIFSHHCTVAFRPAEPILDGLRHTIRAVGRLITDKVDCLIIDRATYFGLNEFPHITLSCAEGVSPVQSNWELASKAHLVQWFDTPVELETRTGNVWSQKTNPK